MKPYKTGYIAGVFDLFHVGHLNILKQAKSRCEYLIVGALTDELVFHFKNRTPIINIEQRLDILAALKCVDRVVPVNFDNIHKMDAWKMYQFDCLFSGDDWINEPSWIADKQRLNEVGSNIEFFSYTPHISTTQIKMKIKQE